MVVLFAQNSYLSTVIPCKTVNQSTTQIKQSQAILGVISNGPIYGKLQMCNFGL